MNKLQATKMLFQRMHNKYTRMVSGISEALRQPDAYYPMCFEHVSIHADRIHEACVQNLLNKYKEGRRSLYIQRTTTVLPSLSSTDIVGYIDHYYQGQLAHREVLTIQESNDGTKCIVPYSPKSLIRTALPSLAQKNDRT